MISVKQADKIIQESMKKFPAKKVSLEKAYGAILQEDIIADRDLPAFDKSCDTFSIISAGCP